MFQGFAARRQFSDLSEAEVLALAISSEEDDARIYATYAEQLRSQYPATAAIIGLRARAAASQLAVMKSAFMASA